MADLLALLQQSRRTEVTVNGWTFTVRRPTDEEALEMFQGGSKLDSRKLSRLIMDWRGLTGADIVADGGEEPAPFSVELARDWLADHLELWQPLTEASISLYEKHLEARDAAPKS